MSLSKKIISLASTSKSHNLMDHLTQIGQCLCLIEKRHYPTDDSNKTAEKLVKNKSKFKVDQGTVCFNKENKLLAAFIPVSQRVETVLRYQQNLGQTHSRNLYLFLQNKAWWPGMLKDIQDT